MSERTTQGHAGWNLFARELQAILEARHFTLWSLASRTRIHREVVRRLVRSLAVAKSFTTLNPEQVQQVTTAFALTDDERLRLTAAVLATAVEAVLMDRIARDVALHASERVFEVLLDAMRRDAASGGILISVERRDNTTSDTFNLDIVLGDALMELERAHLALHISYLSAANDEGLQSARQAEQGYLAALQTLSRAAPEVKSREEWHVWQTEAESGRRQAASRIVALGGLPFESPQANRG
jgi:hypothetical protein